MNNSSPTSNFLGLLGRSYTLKWTITNGACSSNSYVTIVFSYAPAQPLAFSASPSPVCQLSSGYIYTVPAVAGATSYVWNYSGSGATITGTTNSVSIGFNATATSGTLSVTAVNGCGVGLARTKSVTVTPLPIASFSYTGTPYCQNVANPTPVLSPGGVAGTFSSTAGLVFVSTATGQVNLATSTPGTYTVTNTIAPASGCGIVTATNTILIYALSTWIGTNSTDWFDSGNWSCCLPSPTVDAIIPNVITFFPVISGSGAVCKNVIIQAGASLTIAGSNSLGVYGNWTNNNSFVANASTVSFYGNTVLAGTSVNTFNNFNIRSEERRVGKEC